MIEPKINSISGKTSRSSLFLSRSFLESNRIERNLEKKSLTLKKKLVEERSRTLKAIASRNRETQKGGVLGGALGLLGLGGGGGGLLRRGLRRTPRSPNQLLRMQRGTSNLSRVGRLGKLARPLAVVGTGLDFIGRRAEGQSNVQAGVGAAGGLGGSLAGAKAGAILGTAVGGPIGTVIGGAGGAIIGSLAGGRLADLFTGANRRRQFEEERVVLRTQKTLFSEALDDFDKVLDKFEDVSIGLAIGRGRDDDEEGGKRKRPRLPIVPTTPFLQRPAVKVIGTTALALGLTVLAVKFAPVILAKGAILLPAFKTALKTKGFSKLPLEKQLRVIAKEISREKLIKRMSEAFDRNNKTVIKPGVKSAKRDRIFEKLRKKREAEEILRQKSDPKVEKLIKKAKRDQAAQERFIRDTGFDPSRDSKRFLEQAEILVIGARDTLQRRIPNFFKTGKIFNLGSDSGAIKKFNQQISGRLQDLIKLRTELLIRKTGIPRNQQLLRRKLDDQIDGINKAIDFLEDILDDVIQLDPNVNPSIQKDIPSIIDKLSPILKGSGNKISGLEPDSDNTNIALAPMGNVFLFGGNNNNNQQSPTIINESSDLAMSSNRSNLYDDVINNIRFESALTA